MARERFPSVRLICNQENVGFAKAVNRGAASSARRYLLFLNSDAQLLPGALASMLELAEAQPQAGVVGPQMRHPDGSFQASYACFPTLRQEFLALSGLGRILCGPHYPSHYAEEGKGPQQVNWVSGACMLVRRCVFDAVGGFDEGYFMYAEEVDLCFRMRSAGWQTWYQPTANVLHCGGASSRTQRTIFERDLYRSRVRFFRVHYGERPAQFLCLLIYTVTAIKILYHGGLRRLSGGRYGRPVVGLRSLDIHVRNEP
jgi:hypothetical protein